MKYFKDVECPFCHRLSNEYALLDEWTMQSQIVNRVECPSCKGVFRIYQGERLDGTPFLYIIKGR